MANRSLNDLMGFLDYLGDKGLMTKNAVTGRKAAVGKVLGVLDPEEVEDVFTINLDQTMTRFINLEGKSYTQGSLKSYQSRVAASLADFASYLKDPLSFKPAGGKVSTKPKDAKGRSSGKQAKTSSSVEPRTPEDSKQEPAPFGSNVLPIPIRENLVVRIFGLPFDLKPNEANKIASVVKAMAMETE